MTNRKCNEAHDEQLKELAAYAFLLLDFLGRPLTVSMPLSFLLVEETFLRSAPAAGLAAGLLAAFDLTTLVFFAGVVSSGAAGSTFSSMLSTSEPASSSAGTARTSSF